MAEQGQAAQVFRLPDPMARIGPDFTAPVVGKGAYVWWYVDAISDDGKHGLTMIAFIGSVFSPYYAWSNWADPYEHCAINVALYRLDGAGGQWAMTERSAKAMSRSGDHFAVGPSALRFENNVLTADINEITVPIPSRLNGKIRLEPIVETQAQFAIDSHGKHIWRPLAPRARVELSFAAPALTWSGEGYFDTNAGSEPLEKAFAHWHWGRAHRKDDLALFYDVARRDGGKAALALQVDAQGVVRECPTLPTQPLPRPFWRMARTAWADQDRNPSVIKTLEDAPFYARSALRTSVYGQEVVMMHESLDLDRLSNPVIRAMLPFRMPRNNF